jgi:hypothetical protein
VKKIILTFVLGIVLLAVTFGQSIYISQGKETKLDTLSLSKVERITFGNAIVSVKMKDSTSKMYFNSIFDYAAFKDPSIITSLPAYIYVPYAFRDPGFLTNTGTYYWGRKAESEHFALLWEPGFGTNPAAAVGSYATNVTLLLQRAEACYNFYSDSLKFIDKATTKTSKYKILIFLKYTTDWVANGSGYDDLIGGLNVSPWAAGIGATISHEIGHTFQYLVHCDLGINGTRGFMYGLGSGSGNGFWEQTAQWQANQLYPTEVFGSSNFGVFTAGAYKSLFHEDNRYANYFIHFYWAYKHGLNMIGRIWRESVKPEDPAQAYMRLNSMTLAQFNDEIWDWGARLATWDIPAIRVNGAAKIGAITTKLTASTDGFYKVDSATCVQDHGVNIIPLKAPTVATTVTATFQGLTGTDGYRKIDLPRSGRRYGFVALLKDNTRLYGSTASITNGTVSMDVPANVSKLWLVVTGAPTIYKAHTWDDVATNDEEWPYQVKFEGTSY